jgi:hypothetical protein
VDHRKRLDMIALAAAIVVLLGAGVARAVTFDDDDKSVTAAGQSTTTSAAPTTVTSTPPTTAAAAPATTIAPGPPPPTTAPAPATTVPPTTATTAVDCGKGEARAKSEVNAVTQPDNTFVITVKVEIVNDITKAIAIDKLAVRVTYHDTSQEVIDFPNVHGAQIPAKETRTFTREYPSTKVPTASAIDPLDFHIADQPSCPAKHLQT